jgi:thiol:disulfide interchange protein DsbC
MFLKLSVISDVFLGKMMSKENMIKIKLVVIAAISCFASITNAQQSELQQVESNLRSVNTQFGKARIVVVRELSDVKFPGLYEATVDGQSLVVSKDGTMAIVGDVFDLQNMVNLTRIAKQKGQADAVEQEIAKLSDNDLVIYPAKGKSIGQLYVFSDTTCGYCKKLHLEVEDYQNAGIDVKYIPYPRSQLVDGEPAFENMKQVMCAKNKANAMTKIKAGTDNGKFIKESYPEECVESIRKGRAAGRNVGLEGTPFMYLSKGDTRVIPGYQSSRIIISLFNQ